MDVQAQPGFIVWFTGMSGTGKSALAKLVHQRFTAAGRAAELLDADDQASPLAHGVDQSRDGSELSARRVGLVAKMLARNGVVAVCAALSPLRESRELLRREARRFVEVFVDCPMELLMQRDPIYRKAMAGEVKNVAGVDDPYEPPTHAELTVHSDVEPPEAAVARLFQALVDLKYVGPAEFGRLTGGARPRRRPGKAPPAKKARSSPPVSPPAEKSRAARPPAGKARAARAASRPARKLAVRSPALRQARKKLARHPK